MKIINTLVLLTFTLPAIGASATPAQPFEMTVDKVTELKGFVLKGLALQGKVKSGCIASNDMYQVYRNGKPVFKSDTQILDVEKHEAFEAAAGDNTNFYVRDGKPGQVIAGDVLKSTDTHCKPADTQAQAQAKQ